MIPDALGTSLMPRIRTPGMSTGWRTVLLPTPSCFRRFLWTTCSTGHGRTSRRSTSPQADTSSSLPTGSPGSVRDERRAEEKSICYLGFGV